MRTKALDNTRTIQKSFLDSLKSSKEVPYNPSNFNLNGGNFPEIDEDDDDDDVEDDDNDDYLFEGSKSKSNQFTDTVPDKLHPPMGAPRNLIAQKVKGTLVTVSWDEPEKFKQKALYDIHSYSVFYKTLDSERFVRSRLFLVTLFINFYFPQGTTNQNKN